MKLLPFTVRLKAAPPALTDVGESEEIDGTGLLGGGGGADPFPPPHEAAQKTDTRRTKACSRRVAMCPPGTGCAWFYKDENRTSRGRGKIALAKRFVKCLRNDCQSSLEMSPFSISLRSLLLVDRCLCPQRSPGEALYSTTTERHFEATANAVGPPIQQTRAGKVTRRSRGKCEAVN
jgi:hypothetical protein